MTRGWVVKTCSECGEVQEILRATGYCAKCHAAPTGVPTPPSSGARSKPKTKEG